MTPLVVLGIFKNISATYASIEEIFSQIVYCRDMIKVINAELPNSTNSREIMKQKSKGVKMTPLVVLVLKVQYISFCQHCIFASCFLIFKGI